MQTPQIIQIPSFTADNLFTNPQALLSNRSGETDKSIKDRLEIEYTHKNARAFPEYRKFNRYLQLFPDEELTSLIPYVFFVRPDLNILTKKGETLMFANPVVENDPTFRWLASDCPEALISLSSDFTDDHDFLPFIGNHVESFPTFDYSLIVNDNTQAFTGYRSFYAGNAIQSTTGVQFDIEFRDTKDLETSKLFYAWAYYIDGIVRNKFPMKPEYRANRIADYYTSMYYFLCAPDGERIVYYEKIVGAFPTNVPLSGLALNMPMTPNQKISISFSAFNVEHMNPIILSEFNYNARMIQREGNETWKRQGKWRADPSRRARHYDPDLMRGKTFVGHPYVWSDDGSTYYLLWNQPDQHDKTVSYGNGKNYTQMLK